jgi:hypothetical protein
MTDAMDPREHVDQKLVPYLPYVGAIAIDSARLEWGLAQLRSMLTNQPLEGILRKKNREQVDAIKEALQAASGTDRELWADAITSWATTAQDLLKKRGDLMHSWWILGDTPSPADLVRTGQLTEEQAQTVDPTDFVNVYSYRLRADKDDLPIKRTVPAMAEFARTVREHRDGYLRMWFAAGVVLGLWPAPDE